MKAIREATESEVARTVDAINAFFGPGGPPYDLAVVVAVATQALAATLFCVCGNDGREAAAMLNETVVPHVESRLASFAAGRDL